LRTMRTGARVIVLIMVSTLDMVWAVLLRTLLQTTSAVAIFMCFLVNLGIGAALLRWFAYKTNTSFLEVLGAGVLARGAPAATPTYGTQDPASSARERR
jgi:ABC-type xylose transport system permease subunit